MVRGLPKVFELYAPNISAYPHWSDVFGCGQRVLGKKTSDGLWSTRHKM